MCHVRCFPKYLTVHNHNIGSISRLATSQEYREAQKLQRELRRTARGKADMKTLRLKSKISNHDLEIKVRHMREFLTKGLDVRVIIQNITSDNHVSHAERYHSRLYWNRYQGSRVFGGSSGTWHATWKKINLVSSQRCKIWICCCLWKISCVCYQQMSWMSLTGVSCFINQISRYTKEMHVPKTIAFGDLRENRSCFPPHCSHHGWSNNLNSIIWYTPSPVDDINISLEGCLEYCA